MAIATTPHSDVHALLSCPTSLVAVAVRAGASSVAGVQLTAEILRGLGQVLRVATGSDHLQLEHFRDPRPLGEMLEVARMVSAQRRLTLAAA
jgi:hypothetical protein